MPEYNKLVRDKIPDIIRQTGKKPITHIAKGEEYEKALTRKLREEVAEFLTNPSVEEAADVLEVIQTICTFKKIDVSKLETVRQKKAAERGGFKERIILEKTE